MSWVIVDTKTGKALMETHSRYTADQAEQVADLKAIPAAEYLGDLNEKIREGAAL